MSLFLRLRAWQLFVLLFALPMLTQVTGTVLFAVTEQVGFFVAGWALAVLAMGLFGGWFWAMGTRLATLLPPSAPARLGWFKAGLRLAGAYLLLLIALVLVTASGAQPSFNPLWMLLILPLHLPSMAGIFYAVFFVARTLKAVELQRPVQLGDYLGEFFLLWFFPVGVWIIQPRINQLFADPQTAG